MFRRCGTRPCGSRVRAALLGLGVVAGLLALMWEERPAAADGGRANRGERIFRHDTFGDEQLWTDQLGLHLFIEESLSPELALALGLKVDVDALPNSLIQALQAGEVDLTDPAVTVALIRLNAVVGVMGRVKKVDGVHRLVEVGITCALCHSSVDNSLAPGIGRRLDGWANIDLDPGAIIAAAPGTPDELKPVYLSWGPGKYDPRFNIDGQNHPVVIPPAYGLADVDKETFTADGPVTYWNQYVAVTQMGGQGSFSDPRLGIEIVQKPDRVVNKLRPLRDYQFTLETPPPPAGSFDPDAAERGEQVFHGAGKCASCHIPPLYTDINQGILHDAEETGMDPAYAKRTATGKYRTTPLRALWQHPPYFHDGSAATLGAVVEHYDSFLELNLTDEQKLDLVEFLKSL